MSEWTDPRTGDVYRARECQSDEPGCVVIEKYMNGPRGVPVEPTDEFHVPRPRLEALVQGLPHG